MRKRIAAWLGNAARRVQAAALALDQRMVDHAKAMESYREQTKGPRGGGPGAW